MTKLPIQRFAYEPDYEVPPGSTLQETIDHLGMTQAQLATRTGLSKKTINRIIQGHEPITHTTALKLEFVTRVPAHFWNERELRYRERLARRSLRQDLGQAREWLKTFPVAELVKRGYVPRCTDPVIQTESVLQFFGVSSPAEFETVWQQSPGTHFRKSPAFASAPGAVASWLRIAEIKATQMNLKPFARDQFRAALQEIKHLSVDRPEVFLPRLIETCSACGLALVFVPEMKGTHISGAAKWLSPDKPMIVLSLRYKRNDRFWFNFFHEAGHILKHSKKRVFIDDGRSSDAALELEADNFARAVLIPAEYDSILPTLIRPGQIRDLARRLRIAPGIVVGRIHHDTGDYTIHNELKEVIDFSVVARALGDVDE